MDERRIIMRCLNEECPIEVSTLGEGWVARIVDDAMKGVKTSFRAARGGHNFDLTENINTLLEAASLVASLLQLWFIIPKGKTKAENQKQEEEDEALATLLVRALEQNNKANGRKTYQLARFGDLEHAKICDGGN